MSETSPSNVEQFQRVLADHLPYLKSEFHVQTLGLFGSYTRNEQNPESDLDVLVTFSQTPSLIQFVRLENYLSDLLGVNVDLVMREALKPHLGVHILSEVVTV
jgi:uncharacterized protein